MRTRNSYIRKGQFTLIIGIFILVLVIILALSLYLVWKYLKNNAENKILKIKDLTNYIVLPRTLTIKNHTITIRIVGQYNRILTGISSCINRTSEKYLNITRKLEIASGRLIAKCVPNDSIILALLYDNYRRQKITIGLDPRYYKTLLDLEGSNVTLRGELRVQVNVFYQGLKVYSATFIKKVPDLVKIYNTDLVYVLDIPRDLYTKPNREIMYVMEHIRNICLKEDYCYINEDLRYHITGTGACKGLSNISISGIYPSITTLSLSLLGNCSVGTMITVSENISKIFLEDAKRLSLNMTLARLLSLNQIIDYTYTGIFSITTCSEIENNVYNCSITPEFAGGSELADMYFELNNTGMYYSNLSTIRAFLNGDLIIDIYVISANSVTASLIAYLYLGYTSIIPLPVASVELFNLTVTCTPIISVTGTSLSCSATFKTYNTSSNINIALELETPIYLLLEYYSIYVSRTTILLEYRNMTLYPLS